MAVKYALHALHQHGRLPEANLTIFLNTNEEIGPLGSRSYLEALAVHHDVGLIFEGSHDQKLARQRKGPGQAWIKLTGREAYAGEAHAEGVSANLELAHKVLALEAITDYDHTMTVSECRHYARRRKTEYTAGVC